MAWKPALLERLAKSLPCGYHMDGPAASEPTAWAGLALLAHGQTDAARQAADWLARLQSRSQKGPIGVTESCSEPNWPTSLAILLWQALDQAASPKKRKYTSNIGQAVDWALAERGRVGKQHKHIGHDTTLVGWSWAADTSAWLEPTAMFTLALKEVGQGQHARTREGVRLLVDRQLPQGGCNYGNTIVLGQPLLAHLQPTGLAMMALAGEGYDDPRTERSLNYLERDLTQETPTASLCYGLLGLAAHGRRPVRNDLWLQHAYERVLRQDASPYKLALIALAAKKA